MAYQANYEGNEVPNDEYGTINYGGMATENSVKSRCAAFCTLGVFLLLLCDVLWATADVIVSTSYVQPCFIVALLGVCQGSSAAIALKYRGEPLLPDHDRGMLALISVLGLAGTTCIVYGLENLQTGNAVALSSCVPLFAYIFGFMYKVSKCNVVGFVCSLATCVGALVIAQPDFMFGTDGESEDSTLDILIAFSASVFFGLYIVLVGKYGERILHLHQSLYLAVTGVCYLPICAIFVGEFALPETPTEWWQCWGFALFWGWGTICAIGGFAMESPVLAGILGTGEIVLAYVFSWIFLGEAMTWWTVLGSVLIVGASCVFAVMDSKPDETVKVQTEFVDYHSIAPEDNPL